MAYIRASAAVAASLGTDEVAAATRTQQAARSFWSRHSGLFAWLSVALAMFAVIKNLWVTDDAYITFRTVDNFLHGYGLTWNTDERVQSYTHPLWMLLLSAATFIGRDIFYACLALSFLCTVIALAVLAFRIRSSWQMAVFCVFGLAVSKSFVDFSTSGLENPLTHLLLALFALVYLRHTQEPTTFASYPETRVGRWLSVRLSLVGARLRGAAPARLRAAFSPTERYLLLLTLLAGLAAFNRMDTLLLYLPALGYAFWTERQRIRLLRSISVLALGFLPFILWECFAILYYGFPFPNTAYAKLDTGISALTYAREGITYLHASAIFDPVLLVLLPVGLFLPLLFKGRRSIPLALGAMLYMLYVVKIGGDFMAGRFLTAPLFLAVILLARCPAPHLKSLPAAAMGLTALGFLGLGIFNTNATLLPLQIKSNVSIRGVVGDERSLWGPATDITNIGHHAIPNNWLVGLAHEENAKGARFVFIGPIGYFGYSIGPHVHVLDYWALNDSFLSRLPVLPYWRIGHFYRPVPPGYVETLLTGQNHIQDKDLAAYYDQMRLVTRGNIFDPQRLLAIWRLNTGQLDYLLHPLPPSTPSPPGLILAPDSALPRALALPFGRLRAW